MPYSETPYRIEPTTLESVPAALTDVIADLSASAATLGRALHQRSAANLASLVRVMNSYYSNLIEGNTTRPREIERALAGGLDGDEKRRNLQLEAAAHVRVQAKVDALAADGLLPEPASEDFIRWLHREFYDGAPAAMLRVRGASRDILMTAGEWRNIAEHDVAVGRHLPPESAYVTSFMAYFASRYRLEGVGQGASMIAMAGAHHRFNFIHPFPDGNGRVSRLMSHAMAHKAGIGAYGLWSISRGLARGLESRGEYKRMMDDADSPREGDLDGRGNLSLRALHSFVAWFLQVCRDQVKFMAGLFELGTLRERFVRLVAATDGLKPEAAHILQDALVRGEIARGEASRVTGLPERTAREVLAALERRGLLASDTPKGPVSLRFPTHTLDILFPRLYPET